MSLPPMDTVPGEGSGVLQEISYGKLGDSLLFYGLGMSEPLEESGQALIYSKAELLNRNPQFSSPDDVAQMVLDNKINLLPRSETFKKYRIIPVQLETGEVCLLYSPDNGQGVLDKPDDYHWSFTTDFQAVYPQIPLENTQLVICTHSDFESIAELIGNPAKAGKYLSIFDSLEDGKVNELIESILAMGRKLGASDIHIEPGIQHSQIMMRRHGMLQLIPSKFRRVSHEVGNKIAMVLILQGGKNLSAGTPEDAAYRYVKQGTIAQDDKGRGKFVETSNPHLHDTDYRISVIPTVGERFSSVVRLLMGHEGIKSLADLGYDNVDELVDAGKIAYGMVIVCGPTGSGKTTTLAALQNETRDPSKKNITVEDPVEIMLPHHVQSQANAAKGYGMGAALRRILRHDPDRIMVTEIRDEETAKLAIAAGNTGHAVLTTLHANTAAESVKRLQRLGVDTLDIATVVQYVFAQRLVESLSPTDEFVEWYDATNVGGKNELSDLLGFDVPGPVYLRRNTKPEGIVGRIPIYEKIAITPALVDLIEKAEDKVSSPSIEAVALKEGFVPMEIYALKQILKGRTTIAGVLRYVNKRRMRQFQDLALAAIQECAYTEIQ